MSTVTLNNKPLSEFVFDLALDGERAESLSEFTGAARLNPSAMIERSLMTGLQPTVLSNMMHTCLGIYISNYMQAFELSKGSGGVRVVDFLQPLSDDPANNFIVKLPFGGESWENTGMEFPEFIAGEAKGDFDMDISKPSNLAVGKEFKVSLDLGGKTASDINVNATMSPVEAKLDFMIDIMTNLNENRDLISRWHRVWAGEINFFSDFLFNRDIIKRERKLLIRDGEDGMYRESEMRRASGLVSAFSTGKRHLNIASNFVVLSTTGAARLSAAAGGDISSYRSRKDIFRETGSMCLLVVNTIDERFTVYVRGVRRPKLYTFDDIKNFSSNSDALNINALIESFNRGSF